MSSQHGTPSPCVQMCRVSLDKRSSQTHPKQDSQKSPGHHLTKTRPNPHHMTKTHHCPCLQHAFHVFHVHVFGFHGLFARLFQQNCQPNHLLEFDWAHVHQDHAEKDDCFQSKTFDKHRKTTATCQHSASEAPDV